MYFRQVSIVLIASIVLPLLLTTKLHAQRNDAELSAAQIKAVLRVSPQEDNGFIDAMVDKVNEGKLPESLLVQAVRYASQQPSNRFQYFKRTLLVLAKRRGIQL